MGGSDSVEHHYHTIEYKTDPEVMNQLNRSMDQINKLTDIVAKLQKDYQEALKKAQQLQDPQKYEELKEKAFSAFLGNLHKLKFTQPIPRLDGHKYHVLIGNISAGKSSLINYCTGLKLQIGLGQCTLEASEVASNGNVHIWDCPGINQKFSIFQPESLSYFHTADRIFLLYPQSPKNCKEIILILNKIKPKNTYLIRTKCDMWNQSHQKTIQQEVQTDKDLLKKWGVDLPILATSTQKPLNFHDNDKFKKLLIGAL